jgi:imidazolonepropionase-like amidohydrolase
MGIKMKKLTNIGLKLTTGLLLSVGLGLSAYAQDLFITGGRLLDGLGNEIAEGSVLIRDGRILAVSNDLQAPRDVKVINAQGNTIMPAFVEGHRHVIASDPSKWLTEVAPGQMQEFLDAGFTTVLSAIDAQPINEAKSLINEGKIQGPRLFTGTFIPVAGADPDAAPMAGDPARTDPARLGGADKAAPAVPPSVIIDMIEGAKNNGYDYLKTVINTTPNGPEIETLKMIVQEGQKRDMPTIVHAVSVKDAVLAVEAHPAMLVHTPHVGRLDNDPESLERLVSENIPMSSTLSVFLPHFNEEGEPLFRDAGPFPFDTISSAGQGPVNARLLVNAGLTYGYGTDTQWPPKETLHDELRALALVFSPREIVQIITANGAAVTLHGEDFGTLEPGKYGDVVIVEGNPLEDIHALEKVLVTIKEGQVVSSLPLL